MPTVAAGLLEFEGLQMSEIERYVRRYYATVDTLGTEAIVQLFTMDATYNRPGYDVMRGREELRRFYGVERMIDHGRHEISDVVIERNRAAVRGNFIGALRSGDHVEVSFADFLLYEGEMIAERTTYFYQPSV